MIRISLLYFLAAISVGAVMLVSKAVVLEISFSTLLQVHIELALFGWLIQFVLGTAYWMLPRYLKGPKRGSNSLAWGMVALLNGGLWIYLCAHLEILPDSGFLAGRVLELISVGLFIYLHWNRIVAYRRGH
ncbi:MAG: hypothetical protein R3281_03685 [Balneolaceae bacterium]|nr:hypothetical protein [Balneolaceae bacterium]